MRIDINGLKNVKKELLSHFDICKKHQKEYYFISNKLFTNWNSNKANYYKNILANEKTANEKLCFEIEAFISLINEIELKYNSYENIYFANNFDDVLLDEINSIIDKYNLIKTKYNSINTSNPVIKEKLIDNCNFINNSVTSYSDLKNKIRNINNLIDENESSIKSKIISYHIDNIEKTSREIKFKGNEEVIHFDSNKIRNVKIEMTSKYKEISDEIDNMIEQLDKICSWYDTNNSKHLIEKIDKIKINLNTQDSNFVNNINMLNDELEGHQNLMNQLKSK